MRCPVCKTKLKLHLTPKLGLPPTGGDYDWVDSDARFHCPSCFAVLEATVRGYLGGRHGEVSYPGIVARESEDLAAVHDSRGLEAHLGGRALLVGRYVAADPAMFGQFGLSPASLLLEDGALVRLRNGEGEDEHCRSNQEPDQHAWVSIPCQDIARVEEEWTARRAGATTLVLRVPGRKKPERRRRRRRRSARPLWNPWEEGEFPFEARHPEWD